jgi:SynChlorMet cassette protein ScmD
MPLNENDIIAVNPSIVLREEYDDWAILFDPDSNKTLGINPMGVYMWKRLNGRHTIREIIDELPENYEDISSEAITHLTDFIEDLIKRGFASHSK